MTEAARSRWEAGAQSMTVFRTRRIAIEDTSRRIA
jgi:hypothetical protein